MAKGFLTKEFKKIPVDNISPNPNQPRKIFNEDEIAHLADSISSFGIITPLTVRHKNGSFELVAGERRLRAAKQAGLSVVPCYIIGVDEKDSSLMAIVENLQRKDLDFFEEALSLRCLMEKYGLTQQQVADKIGKTQSAVANKLRLLRISPETTALIRKNCLSERHARALLRLPDEMQYKAVETISEQMLNVQQTEEFVDNMLSKEPQNTAKNDKPIKNSIYLVKDVRIFLNTVMRAVDTMRTGGFNIAMKKERKGSQTVVVVTIDDKKNVSRETVRV